TGFFVCVVWGDAEIFLYLGAKAECDNNAELIHMKELLPLTGYIRGGCSPIGMKKPFPTFFHSTATDFDTIYVSAGVRGMQIAINPESLINFVGGTVADLVSI
ncbi:MAG: Cys-tRNA(Pro) deacylase, partial [Paramuribaculum sp.]|nr:Cys-tRNA(Pro) deacylase [Paramuribaculum sp.]